MTSALEKIDDTTVKLTVTLTEEDLALLDGAYPRPPPGSFDVWE